MWISVGMVSSGKDFHQTQLLIQECAFILQRPNFVSTFCYAIDCPLQQQKSLRPSSSLLSQLSKVLKLSSVQEIAFALALLYSSIPEHINHAVNFLKQNFLILSSTFVTKIHRVKKTQIKENIHNKLSQDCSDKIPLQPYLYIDNLDPTMENIGNISKTSDDSFC
ncbi:CCR4-NOT transcription complex subunit 1 [Caerostris extrusa]|uniref:CCR4-NOT transcription complex subunit 1 n=1 Tax=Caerostris extrusa TaxID=172846 RepID=A0AAV4XTE9_CAEEX|nr:CCR4-NOT transcription complex subunit 1 [Caerostris extrusa]